MTTKKPTTPRPRKFPHSEIERRRDFRSPLAKARDEWFETESGRRAMSLDFGIGAVLPSRAMQYLRNRLTNAYIAGADDQKRIDAARVPKLKRRKGER